MNQHPTYEELIAINALLKDQLVKALDKVVELTIELKQFKP